MKEIRIDDALAGTLVMGINSGPFYRPEMDHNISSFRDGLFLGGFVINSFYGSSVCVHDGARDTTWCSRELLAMLFQYVFWQLKCHKAYAPVSSDNVKALEMNLRAGWRFGAVLKDAVSPGVHIYLLEMEPHYCKWLAIPLRQHISGEAKKAMLEGRIDPG